MSIIQKTNGKTLYRIMVEEFVPSTGWKTYFVHTHAIDIAEAKFWFNCASMGRQRRIAMNGFGIAPAIGFKVHDKHGEKLSA